jgi:hypothetical protein
MGDVREAIFDGKVCAVVLYGKTSTGELVPVLVDATGAIVTTTPA